MPRIYISHRPVDSSRNEVRVIRDRLIEAFGEENVMDTTGDHMDTTLERQAMVESCDILLVVIGRYWLEMVDEQGNKLLEDPYDPVHIELSAGQQSSRMIRILLVDNAEKPDKDRLPEVLRWLTQRDVTKVATETDLRTSLATFISEAKSLPNLAQLPARPVEREPQLIRTMSPEPAPPNELVRIDNPRYVPLSLRDHSRDHQPEPRRNNSNFRHWRIAVAIMIALFTCMGSWLGNNRNSTSSPLNTLNNVQGTAQADRTQAYLDDNATPTAVLIPESALEINFLKHYSANITRAGFGRDNQPFLYYIDESIYAINTRFPTEDPIRFTGAINTFHNLVEPEAIPALRQSDLEQVEEVIDDTIILSVRDRDDNRIIAITRSQTAYVLDVRTLDIITSKQMNHRITKVIEPNKTLHYDPEQNLIQFLVSDTELVTWYVGDQIVFLGRRELAHSELSSISEVMLDSTGQYLVALGDEGFSLFEVQIDRSETSTVSTSSPVPTNTVVVSTSTPRLPQGDGNLLQTSVAKVQMTAQADRTQVKTTPTPGSLDGIDVVMTMTAYADDEQENLTNLTDESSQQLGLTPETTDNKTISLQYEFMYEYQGRVADIGFSNSLPDALFIFVPDNRYGQIQVRLVTQQNDTLASLETEPDNYDTFAEMTTPVDKFRLNENEITLIEDAFDIKVVFTAIDDDDHSVIVVSADRMIYQFEKDTLSLLSSHKLSIATILLVEGETLIYNAERNLLVAMNNVSIYTWQVTDDVTLLDWRTTAPYRTAKQIAINQNGTYFAVRGRDAVGIYSINLIES